MFTPALGHHVVKLSGTEGRLRQYAGLQSVRAAVVPLATVLQDLFRRKVGEWQLTAVRQDLPDRNSVGPNVSLAAQLSLKRTIITSKSSCEYKYISSFSEEGLSALIKYIHGFVLIWRVIVFFHMSVMHTTLELSLCDTTNLT